MPFIPGHYARSARWSSTPDSLIPPPALDIEISGLSLRIRNPAALVMSNTAVWDDPQFAAAANRAGKDFYVYLFATTAATPALVLSNNATVPSGAQYSASNTRKLGGFHCLCADVGTIAGHALSGMTAGQILPASVWDLRHRPVASPEGMVYSEYLGKWYQIYLVNINSGSAYNVAPADNGSTLDLYGYTGGSYLWFIELLKLGGMTLLRDDEFQIVSRNGYAGANTADWSGTCGGHSDASGRRLVSDLGLEDTCGVFNQWLLASASIYDPDKSVGEQLHPIPGTNNGQYIGSGYGVLAGGNLLSGHSGPSGRTENLERWKTDIATSCRGCSLPMVSF